MIMTTSKTNTAFVYFLLWSLSIMAIVFDSFNLKKKNWKEKNIKCTTHDSTSMFQITVKIRKFLMPIAGVFNVKLFFWQQIVCSLFLSSTHFVVAKLNERKNEQKKNCPYFSCFQYHLQKHFQTVFVYRVSYYFDKFVFLLFHFIDSVYFRWIFIFPGCYQ